MEEFTTESTSSSTASVNDLLIRDGVVTRIIFRPTLVKNLQNPSACVRGTFVFQKKGINDVWEDIDAKKLSSLKKGEGYKLDFL
jgi:hypothetical protein